MCLTHPVTFPVGGNRSTRWKPTTFGRALTSTLFTWGLGSSHIEKFSLRFEPTTFEVKGKCANHFATECGYWGANSSPGCVLVFPLVRSFNLANESMILYPGPKFAPPSAAFPNFNLDVSSSVIYNLYAHQGMWNNTIAMTSTHPDMRRV